MYVRELYFSQCNSGLGNIIINSLPLKSSSKLQAFIDPDWIESQTRTTNLLHSCVHFFSFLTQLGFYPTHCIGELQAQLRIRRRWFIFNLGCCFVSGRTKKKNPKHNNTRADIYSSHKTPAEFTVVNFSYRTPIDFCLGGKKIKKFNNYKILKAVSICAVITYCMYKGASNRISARENIFSPCVIEH